MRESGLQTNSIVSVTMKDMSDGEGWTDMETTQTKMARKKSWSEGGREGESSLRQLSRLAMIRDISIQFR